MAEADRKKEGGGASSRKFTLVNLERHQRIFLGLDDEPMKFDAGTVGQLLVDIGTDLDDDYGLFIRAVGSAFLGLDEHHVISLRNRKKGKFIDPSEHSRRHREIMHLEHVVLRFLDLGLQMKAAVSRTGEIFGRSRAWVFAALREAQYFHETSEMVAASMRKSMPVETTDVPPAVQP